MEFFICLSSIAGILGSGAQANYASGNSFMDALAHHRIMQGEKATTLDLGWMKSDGVIAESVYLQTAVTATGFLKPIAQDEFYALLDRHCDPNLGLLQSSACQPIIGLETPEAMRAKNAKEHRWMQRKMFTHLRLNGLNIGLTANNSVKAVDYAALLSMADSRALAARIIADALVAKLSKAFSIPLTILVDRNRCMLLESIRSSRSSYAIILQWNSTPKLPSSKSWETSASQGLALSSQIEVRDLRNHCGLTIPALSLGFFYWMEVFCANTSINTGRILPAQK